MIDHRKSISRTTRPAELQCPKALVAYLFSGEVQLVIHDLGQ